MEPFHLCLILGVALFVVGLKDRPPGKKIAWGWYWECFENSTPRGKALGLFGVALIGYALILHTRLSGQQAIAQLPERLQEHKAAVRELVEAEFTKKAEKANRLLVGFGIGGAESTPGVLVQRVREGSPAARLGVRKGDSILRLNGQRVTTVHDCLAALGDKPDWSRVTVTVLRDGWGLRLPKK
jgi:membrane-associated protease RseP (regulator of RpoE activity)